MQLWSAGPDALLLGERRAPAGAVHRQLAWLPTGRRIACAAGTHVLFYFVDRTGTEPFASSSVAATIGSASCIVADESAVLVGGGADGVSGNAALYSWAGVLLHTLRLAPGTIEVLSPTTPPILANPAPGAAVRRRASLVCTCLHLGEHTLASVMATAGDGTCTQAMLAGSPAHPLTRLLELPSVNAVTLPAAGATCVAVGARYVAVGGDEGDVRLYAHTGSVMGSAADGCPAALSLRTWGYETGGVSCLAFASDGVTIAVGYARHGASVFGRCGTLIAHWPLRTSAALARGTTAVAWAPGDAHVLAIARDEPVASTARRADEGGRGEAGARGDHGGGGGGGERNGHGGAVGLDGAVERVAESACLWRLGMLLEPGVPGCASASGAAAVLLLAEDHIRVATVDAYAALSDWRAFYVPRSYLHRAWPLQLAAISLAGSYIAVAGARGVAIAPLATERWRFLGASAAQVTPFRAFAITWLSDEALLVVGHSLPPTSRDPRSPDAFAGAPVPAAATTPADGSWLWTPREAGHPSVEEAADADGEAADDDVGEAPRRLSLFVMRSDLREVLLRTDLDAPCPCAPLWGCAVLVAPDADARRGRYGLPPAASIILGAEHSVVSVLLTVPELPAMDDAFASLRFRVRVDGALPLPADLAASPAGLSAVHLWGEQMADDGADAAAGVCGVSDVSDPSAAVDGGTRDDVAGHGSGGKRTPHIEVIIPLEDGAVLVTRLPRASRSGAAVVRRLLPPGSAWRCWHGATPHGTIWTLNAFGLRQWRTRDGGEEGGEATHLDILPPPREVTPVALLPSTRAVIGIACLPAPNPTAPIGPWIHVQPYTHAHLRGLLLDGHVDAALTLARGSFFRRRHCLELLLHEALMEAHERDARARKVATSKPAMPAASETTDLFGLVAALVRELGTPDWLQLVARCARKTDAAYWPRLFAASGQPSEILVRSLDAGEVSCAAAMLLPLRAQSGVAACERAVGLVRAAALTKGMAKLIRQLDQFSARAAIE